MPDPGEFNPNNRIAPGSDSSERSQFDPTALNKQLQLQEEQTDLLRRISDQLMSNQRSTEDALSKANESAETIARLEAEQNRFQSESFARISETENRIIESQGYVSKSISSFQTQETPAPKDPSSEFRRFSSSFNSNFRELKRQNDAQKELNNEILSAALTENFEGIGSERLADVMEKTNLSLDSLVVINRAMLDEMAARGIDINDDSAKDKFKQEKLVDKDFFGRIADILHGEGQSEDQVGVFKNIESKLVEQNDVIEDDIRRRLESEGETEPLPTWFKEVDPEIETMSESLEDIQENTKPSNLGFIIKTIVATVLALATVGGILYAILTKGLEYAKDHFIQYVKGLFSEDGFIGGAIVSIGEFLANTGRKIRALLKIIDPPEIVKSIIGSITGLFTDSEMVSGIVEVVSDFFEGLFTPVGRFLRGKITDIFGFVTRIIESFSPAASFMSRVGSFFGRVGSMFGKVMGFISPVLKFLKFIGSKILLPLTIIITIIDAVVGAIKGFSRDGIKGMIVGIVSGIISGITGIFGISFDDVYNYLMSWVNDFGGTLKKHLIAIGNFFLNIPQMVVNLIVKIGSFLYDLFIMWRDFNVYIVKTVFDFLKSVGSAIWSGIQTLWDFYLEYNPITLLYKAMRYLADKASEILNIDKILDQVAEFMGMIFDGLKDLAYGVLEWITGVDWSSDDPVSDALGTDTETLAEAQKTGEGETAWIAKKTAQNVVGSMLGIEDGPISLPPDPEVTALLAKMKQNQESNIEKTEDQSTMMGEMSKNLQNAQNNINKTAAQPTSIINTNTTNNVSSGQQQKQEPTIIAPQSSRNTEPTIRIMQYSAQPAF